MTFVFNIVHMFFYICIFTCKVYTLSSKLYCIFYLRMKIVKFQRKQASLEIMQKCVTPLAEIRMSITKIHGNHAWVFLEHPWKSHFFFNWSPEFPHSRSISCLVSPREEFPCPHPLCSLCADIDNTYLKVSS